MYNVSTLAPSFLIGSSLFLQVTVTAIKSWMGSKFSKIRNGSAELAALEHPEKISIDLLWEKCCYHSSAFIFGWIFIILAGNKDNHKRLDEFELLPVPITTNELAALERLKNQYYMMTLALSFLNGSFLHVTRKTT